MKERNIENRAPWKRGEQNGDGKNSKKMTAWVPLQKEPIGLIPEGCPQAWARVTVEFNADLRSKTVPVCHGMPYLAGRFSKLAHASSHIESHDDAKTKLGPKPMFNWETKTCIRLATMYLATTTSQRTAGNTACSSSWSWNLSLHQAMCHWGCISPGKVTFSNLHKSWMSPSHDP